MKFKSFIVIFNFVIFSSYAQIVINGFVKDGNGNSIESANIIVIDNLSNILSYTYTNTQGDYIIKLENADFSYIIITANSLGFKKKTDTLRFEPLKYRYTFNFKLEEKIEELNEVLLKPDEKIKREGTTTTFKVSAFKNDTEQTVEDILKTIPGVEVLKDGTIKAHGRFIDKLLIEGEDMFDKNYSILSKNLDAKVLDAVQILEEFEENPIFAKVLDSDKVAINLVLKEGYKNIWFGNISGGAGTDDRIRTGSNLGLIRKDMKFFNFNDFNNLGTKASQQLEDAPNSTSSNNSFREQVIKTEISPIYSIQNTENTTFNEGQSTFNDAFIDALSFVTSIKPNMKLRGTGYFANDKPDQLFSSETIYNVEEMPIFHSEFSDTNSKNSIAGGELELKYSNGEKSYLKNVFMYDNKPRSSRNKSLFNEDMISQKLSQDEYSIYNHFNYSYLIGKKNILHTYLYFGKNNIKQNATIISPVLNEFLSISDNSPIYHTSADRSTTYGGKSTMLVNLGNFKTDIEFGYESLKDERNNLLNTPENNNSLDSLQNHLQFGQQKLQLKANSKYDLSKKVELLAGVSFDNINIKAIKAEITEKSDWLVVPRIGLRLKDLKVGYFSFSYVRNYSEPKSNLFLGNYQLNSYQSLIKGQNKIYFTRNNSYTFYYGIKNELRTKSLTIRSQYISSDGKYSTQNQIGQNIILTAHNFVNSGDLLSLNLDYTSYFKKLALSTNLGTSQSFTNTPIAANTSNFENLKTYSASYLLTGRTYFKSPINFDFRINLNTSRSNFNNIESKTSWENLELNANYKLSDVWIGSLKNNFYFTNNSEYYFIDFKLNFNPKNSRFSYEFILNNLANENMFSIYDIDELATYQSSIQLLPRYAYIWVKYRF